MEEQAKPAKTARVATSLAVIAIVLVLCLAAVTGLLYRKLCHLHQLSQQTHTATQQLHTSLQQFSKAEDNQNTQVADLQKQVAMLQLQHQQTWITAEVDYLIRLANYNLVFTHDLPAALALLQTADQRLATLNNPLYLKVRQSLANNIAALQAVPKLDLAGLLAKLTALQTEVPQLPLLMPTLPKSVAIPQTPTSNLPAWRRALDNSWQTIQKLIVIRHNSHPIEPLLPALQQLYLQQNLQLLLQQAAWAALHGDDAVYATSLKQASDWAARYFAYNATATQAFIQSIAGLQKLNVHPNLPTVNDTLNLLSQVIYTPEAVQPPSTTPSHEADPS